MAKIVISEFMDQAAVDDLAKEFTVIYDKNLVNRPEELEKLASDCDALIVRNKTQVRDKLLEGKNIKVIGRLGVGLDNIDLKACKEKGVEVIPATGANTDSVAEYVLAGLLMLMRGSYLESHSVAAGKWPREKLVGGEIMDKSLGLVGFGEIARAVAKRAKAMGMKIIAYDPFVASDDPAWEDYGAKRFEDLDAMLGQADAVSLHIPLTEDTRRLFDEKKLKKMKQGAVLINTARGGIVDETALAEQLKNGHIAGAMLDVFEKEPLKEGSPLADAPNCILTPHIAGVTRESNVRVSSLIADKVAKALKK